MNVQTSFFIFRISKLTCGELYYKIGIVGLDLCLVCRLVAHYRAATVTAVDDDVSALGVGLCLDRAKYSSAGVGSVAGIYVNVQGAQTKRTVVS